MDICDRGLVLPDLADHFFDCFVDCVRTQKGSAGRDTYHVYVSTGVGADRCHHYWQSGFHTGVVEIKKPGLQTTQLSLFRFQNMRQNGCA